MPRLAIVISAQSSVESLESTLVSVLENRPADCEIVVALTRPYADPYDLKDEVRFVPPSARGSATAVINAALAVTRAPFVHLLASGCQVSEGWADAALARFGDRRIGAVVPLVWDAARENRLLAAGVGYRPSGRRYLVAQGLEALSIEAQATIVGPSSLAGFYRKAALDFVGAFSTQLGLRQADADVALVLRHAGFKVAIEPDSKVIAPLEADRGGSPLGEALADERLFWRNLSQPGTSREVTAHAAHVAWETARAFPRPRMIAQLAGRFWAALQWGSYARHHRALAALVHRAVRPQPINQHVRIDDPHEAPARGETLRVRAGTRG